MVRPVELNGIWYTNKRYFSVFFCSRFTIVANGLATKTATPNRKAFPHNGHWMLNDDEIARFCSLFFLGYLSTAPYEVLVTTQIHFIPLTAIARLAIWFQSIRILTLDLSSEWPQGIPFIFVILCASICRAVQTLMRIANGNQFIIEHLQRQQQSQSHFFFLLSSSFNNRLKSIGK